MYINIYILYTYIPIYILNSREITFSSVFLVLTTKDTTKNKKTFPTSKFTESTFGDSNVLKVLAEISHKANRPSEQRTLLGEPPDEGQPERTTYAQGAIWVWTFHWQQSH